MHWTPKVGKVYGACGGEAVKNIGTKTVEYQTDTFMNRKLDFEIGDRITKPLIAVSDECSNGNAVFFGPAPKYESFIIHDPEAFVCHSGSVTNIKLRNGTYEIDIREKYSPGIANVDDDDIADSVGGPDGSVVELMPDAANAPVISRNLPDVDSNNISQPLIDNRKATAVTTDPYDVETFEAPDAVSYTHLTLPTTPYV